MKTAGIAALVALISIGAGFGLSQYLSSAADDVSAPAGGPGPAFRLPDTEGQFREASDWPNRVLVINFWATWCGPCRKEMPDLMEVRERYADDVEVIGIAIDRPDAVIQFTQDLGIRYPILIGDGGTMAIMRAFGNPAGALPFTLLTDRQYQVAEAILGPVDIALLEEKVDRLLGR